MSELYPDPDLTPAPGTGRGWTTADRDLHSPQELRKRRGPDLRLVPVALAVWLIVTLTVVTRTPWPAIIATILTLLTVALLRRLTATRSTSPRAGLLITGSRTTALAGFCAAAWAGRAAWLVHRADSHLWLTGAVRRFTGTLELAGAPRQISGGGVLLPVDAPGLGTVPLFLAADDLPDPQSTREILDLQPGTALAVEAAVGASDRPGIAPVILSATNLPAPGDGPGGFAAVTGHLRGALRDAASHLPDGAADLVPGMVVGDVSLQDAASRADALATGLSHLTAVSGANLALITGSVLVIAAACGASTRAQVGLAAGCLAAFVALVGAEPSVLRAAVTGMVGLVAVLSARRTHGFAACSAAVLALLAVDPGLAVEYAFILSVVATVGIVAVAPLISRRLMQYWADARARRGRPAPVGWQAAACRLLGVSLAADVVTAPVIAHMTGVVSPTAVVANLCVGPAVPVVTVVGTVGALVAGVWVPAGAVVLWVCAPCAVWITQVARTLARVPVLSTTAGWWAAAAVAPVGAALVVVVVSARWRRPAVGMLAVAAFLAAVAVRTGVLTVGPYPAVVGTGRFGASFQRTWADDLGDGYRKVPGWMLGVRWVDGAPEIIVPAGVSDVSGVGQVSVLPDDGAVLSDERARSPGLPRPALYVVTSCGPSRGMPSATPEGVPVAYPCSDGTVLLAPDGLHASGATDTL
ncbi:ComEC/Rec2 family competence protein [Corynebacterium terpenotabidum]|uniref:ComEC/Rec2-related protein domain-containing protein n=1 Tax=Corynebacterium terpenotabidum Y-11 TaxID=1200352 RepID=S4XB89_9CORY|nr:ComEC/Rec2 family competence protein [Corynebacterium terpenotabidum]AGP30382.1 hypothetical protein A606_03655 [Corynebacterium terpenotabidum Y-11]